MTRWFDNDMWHDDTLPRVDKRIIPERKIHHMGMIIPQPK